MKNAFGQVHADLFLIIADQLMSCRLVSSVFEGDVIICSIATAMTCRYCFGEKYGVGSEYFMASRTSICMFECVIGLLIQMH